MKGCLILDNLQALWKETLTEIENKVSKPSFDTWLKSTEAKSVEGR